MSRSAWYGARPRGKDQRMAVPTIQRGPSELLLSRLARRQQDAALLRERFGDPTEVLHAWVRETFDRDALLHAYQESLLHVQDDDTDPNDRELHG